MTSIVYRHLITRSPCRLHRLSIISRHSSRKTINHNRSLMQYSQQVHVTRRNQRHPNPRMHQQLIRRQKRRTTRRKRLSTLTTTNPFPVDRHYNRYRYNIRTNRRISRHSSNLNQLLSTNSTRRPTRHLRRRIMTK